MLGGHQGPIWSHKQMSVDGSSAQGPSCKTEATHAMEATLPQWYFLSGWNPLPKSQAHVTNIYTLQPRLQDLA